MKDYSARNCLILAETGDLFDVRMEMAVAQRTVFSIEVQGHRVAYDAAQQTISCFEKSTVLRSINGRIKLQLLIDRTSLEIFGNNGEVSMSFCFLPEAANYRLALHADNGEVRIHELTVHELRSAWGH
jgi:sucrose-6-phosphate hydrolase SacC (GH32 family)